MEGEGSGLQIRLRDRFRVTVTRPRRWTTGLPEAADSCYSATLRRAILRLRSLLGDASLSSPSSSMPMPPPSRILRVKTESKDEDRIDGSVIFQLLQSLAIPVIGNVCHVFMHGLNHIQIYGLEKFHSALLRRPKGKALLTQSCCSVDDPFVIASLLPPSVMLDARNVRWTLCATDRCFRNPTLSTFFSCCKVLPVSRGDGVYQKGMDMALSKLNNGGWVHIFPEGSRSRDGGRTMASSKRGVGSHPLVHTGMQEIMPIGSCLPRIGKRDIPRQSRASSPLRPCRTIRQTIDDTRGGATDRRSLHDRLLLYSTMAAGGGPWSRESPPPLPPTESLGFAARGLLRCAGGSGGGTRVASANRRAADAGQTAALPQKGVPDRSPPAQTGGGKQQACKKKSACVCAWLGKQVYGMATRLRRPKIKLICSNQMNSKLMTEKLGGGGEGQEVSRFEQALSLWCLV
ncbi:unnamed protein product [Spirodela intermedia]|uniref:Tafazzin family protein n=1 Tax=Spirodela intermedia TaxID=51605 RepID=A0A7I8J291_SPIIN|nr:unnamed protein product [Spirodela intermedia]CAA6663440.1 unnamed protein product [Spirodela intermedia]